MVTPSVIGRIPSNVPHSCIMSCPGVDQQTSWNYVIWQRWRHFAHVIKVLNWLDFGFFKKVIILGRSDLIRQTLQKKRRGRKRRKRKRMRRVKRRERRKRWRRGALLLGLKEKKHPVVETGWKKAGNCERPLGAEGLNPTTTRNWNLPTASDPGRESQTSDEIETLESYFSLLSPSAWDSANIFGFLTHRPCDIINLFLL